MKKITSGQTRPADTMLLPGPMFSFPELEDDGLMHVAVCAIVDVSNHDELSKWFTANQGNKVAAYSNKHGRARFARRVIGRFDTIGHFHLECAVESVFPSPPKENTTIDDIRRTLPELQSASFTKTLIGRFNVPKSKLPPKGVVSILLGASSIAGSSELRIRGCKFDVVGGGPFVSVEWNLPNDDVVNVELAAALSASSIADSALIEAETLLRQGFESLILELKPLQEATSPSK